MCRGLDRARQLWGLRQRLSGRQDLLQRELFVPFGAVLVRRRVRHPLRPGRGLQPGPMRLPLGPQRVCRPSTGWNGRHGCSNDAPVCRPAERRAQRWRVRNVVQRRSGLHTRRLQHGVRSRAGPVQQRLREPAKQQDELRLLSAGLRRQPHLFIGHVRVPCRDDRLQRICANLLLDANNCGSCGTVCTSGACANGRCMERGLFSHRRRHRHQAGSERLHGLRAPGAPSPPSPRRSCSSATPGSVPRRA